ncbi:MAG: pyridoxamine 5'-phosphate oxidase family protein [Actinomycetota bacterium]
MPRLDDDELQDFLTSVPGVPARIGTVDDDGAPSVVPVWFLYDEGRVLITARARSAWWGHLRRDPRIAISIDEDGLPYRKVTVRGRIEVLNEPGEDDLWRETYRAMAARYVGAEAADRYLEVTIEEPRSLLGIALDGADVEVSTWRMPVRGEDPTGIWARRYYVAD